MNSQNLTNDASNGLFTSRFIDWPRYIRSLWKEHIDAPLNADEIALAIYLLDSANRHRWAMPFECSTSTVCGLLLMSRGRFLKAREGLSRRNMISYAESDTKGKFPTYSVVLSDYVMRRSRSAAPSVATPMASAPASTAPATDAVGLDELEARLAADERWLGEIVELMKAVRTMCTAEVKAELADFFRYLRCQGTTSKGQAECRKHFVNWLRKQSTSTNLNQSNYGTTANQHYIDPRRSTPVTAKSAKDYEGPF